MINNVSVGNRIAHLRKQKRFTQEEMAQRLGITAQAISKWENGHTLPETALLPALAVLFDCSIDSILTPFAAQDAAFRNFARISGDESCELTLQLYDKIKSKFDFTIEYNDEYQVYHDVIGGRSARFYPSDKARLDFRIDVNTQMPTDAALARVALPHCANYMHIIDSMPEHIKEKFRCNDCTRCRGYECCACMVYTFEAVDYRQCHFITISLDCSENMEYIFTLLCAESGR